MTERKYYEAYDDRYRQVHQAGLQWFTHNSSPIVEEVITKYNITPAMQLLELGCGEGRDAQHLLKRGFGVTATDISPAAIDFCKSRFPAYGQHFKVLDCVKGALPERFDFIYAVAVVHMLLLDEDRNAFYQFIRHHLTEEGLALICTMGDGETERCSDIHTAFELQERNCQGKPILVAGTSCRIVSIDSFQHELTANRLEILELGQTCIPNEFSAMMYAIVRKAAR